MTVALRSEANEVVASLRRFISRGEYGLKEVPQLVREVLEHGYWHTDGRSFASFAEFVEADPPLGLGATVGVVRRLIADDTTTLALFDRETEQRPSGRPPKTHDNVRHSGRGQRRTGNDRVTALRRLRKERADLYERVLREELSPHGAMVEAGFRPRAYRLPLTVDGLVAAVRKHFTPEQIAAVVRRLAEAG